MSTVWYWDYWTGSGCSRTINYMIWKQRKYLLKDHFLMHQAAAAFIELAGRTPVPQVAWWQSMQGLASRKPGRGKASRNLMPGLACLREERTWDE
ncbi:hypothetical protein CEXT_628141 [Caerostris extrusa]|uniref:Uncharacterized protein n=1 Tax=Caerostris extrusa TaxID=172846 RepID=A0AAV4UQ15_CAEEX|nr:hypothetical protein CEXT_628141 [Caerostris extrusa]